MVKIEEVSEVEDHHIHRWKYDVFLSFRGKDIRKTFVDHLYSALARRSIYTFQDDERLETGESISPALLKAIEESSFAVIIFSKNYASSQWCLDELVKIMECSSKSPKGQIVIPIFYDVQPSDVRKQEGHFGEMFRKHNSDRIQIWRKTLTNAANLSGLELDKTVDGHESKFIDRIVQEIWRKLQSNNKVEGKVLFGMKSRIEKVTSLLGEESNVVRTVAIWGLGGIGKSTLARAVYLQIEDQFEVACFLHEVGEVSKKDGLRSLQQHLLSKTLREKDLQIENDMNGIALMRTRLQSRRVLLVLDNVDSSEQLEKLAGSHEWFGPGSRIIITTRDRKLLLARDEIQIHKASVLNHIEATELFCSKAFNDMCPPKDFKELTDQVIYYCGGLPLALEVLGSALNHEDLDVWKDSLQKLREVGLDGGILEKLKIGFDGLDGSVQNTFLDIACFYSGRKEESVTRILDSFHFYPNLSISILSHKSLVHRLYGRVCMHQLIREMGWHIVRQNFPQQPWKHSRLWDTSDVEHVLTRSTGTENIEGILLNPKHLMPLEMGTKAFRKMSKLRLLEIHNTCIPKGPDHLPNELRWIDWDEYPSKYLPATFEADFLVGLRLHCSWLKQIWEGRTKKKMKNLKYVDLSHSQNLVGILHLGEACNLEVLNLSGCVKLQKLMEIHENMDKLLQLHLGETAIEELPLSIVNMPNLVLLDLHHCKNLVILPSTLCTLKRLKSLILSGCLKVKKLPEEMGNLECLEELLLDGTDVIEPPPSIGCLKKLKNLSFRKSSSQSSTSIFQFLFQLRKRQKTTSILVLPPIWGLTSLTRLDLTNCNLLEGAILGSLFSLRKLCLGGNNFENLPSLNQLSQLVHIELNRCEMLRELPELPSRIKRLFANDCASLTVVPVDRLAMYNIQCFWFQNCRKLLDYGENEILASTLLQQRLQLSPNWGYCEIAPKEIILPGRTIPEWFCNHTFMGYSALLKFPQNWYINHKIKGYSFFVILEVVNKSCKSAEFDYKKIRHQGITRFGTRQEGHVTYAGGHVTDVGVEFSFTEPGHFHSMHKKPICLLGTDKIIGLEHTIMGYETFYIRSFECSQFCNWKEGGEIEVCIRSLNPDITVVKKWGLRLVFNDDEKEQEAGTDYDYDDLDDDDVIYCNANGGR